MFFITEPDINFRIKGSRDPLGFQPIWQKLGRKVIKDLSTVSINIRDFQLMSFAWYFWGDRPDKNFMAFFYKFEQACAYTRELYFEKSGYNGKEFVSKRRNDLNFRLSTNNADTILSNQKTYGVFGKYNRPFTEMRIKYQDDFISVMESAIQTKTDSKKLLALVDMLITEDVVIITKEELQPIADLLGQLSDGEKQFYERLILETSTHKCQNELYHLFKKNPELRKNSFQLYPFIESVLKHNISLELKVCLVEIKNTESVLYAYANLFRHLQSRPVWQLAEINEEEIFNYFPKKQDYVFEKSAVLILNEELASLVEDKSKIALAAVQRNETVSKRRNNSAWIKQEKGKLVRYYADGGREISKLDVNNVYENNYFIPTYISLFNQINPVI
jgi:hypothetical protein